MNKQLPIGPIMIDISGTTLSQYDKEKIAHPNSGAIILFARNYADPEQVAELCQQIKASRNGPILIAVDQEGGRVQRFQNGFTRLPPVAAYAENQELCAEAGWLMAAELLVLGVDFSFAPVLDIDCGVSQIIGNRSFSQDPELACQLASSFRRGMRSAGMAATGKHFPGHGAVALDSHLTLPIDKRDFKSIYSKDILPFKHLIKEGLEAIMPAHVVYPEIDELPAGFSAIWINEILRTQLGFNGAVFSDDLSMEGAACVGDFTERARLAREAGCDMILVCNNEPAAEQVLESTPIKHNPTREQRLLAMQGKTELTTQALKNSDRWQSVSQQLIELANSYAE
ncbi:beta-N-acetylhexosaminidase [Methyloprofundus sp.]|uniref:beta-N-acetylhexosaminidase n=1 Tax=Methyloprofundus sp. TaxID=2020875 RepID=UPI003D0CBC08